MAAKQTKRKKNRPLKRIEKWLKNRYLDLRIYLHYQDLNPNVIKLSQSTQRVSVNPADARARKKLIVDSLRGRLPRNQLFWRQACQQLQPSVALDVGVNYGECLFSVDYSQQTRAIGIEANPCLLSHLQASQNYHPSADQIELHNVLAGGDRCDEVSFYINQETSGESTAAQGSVQANPKDYEQVTVPQICVDDLLQGAFTDQEANAGPLVFKIDVEGYEQHVFRGMQSTLESAVDLIGLIEFDLSMLEGAGSNPQKFFEFLAERFDVYLFVEKTAALPVGKLTYPEFHSLLSKTKFHSDLLLVRAADTQKYTPFPHQWLPKSVAA